MSKCLVCDNKIKPFIDFGLMPIANAFETLENMENEYKFPMEVGFCEECKMVQLLSQPEREKMFHENYAFFSSTSKYMQHHFNKLADNVIKHEQLDSDSFVVEIGCNDGILISNFQNSNVPCLGVEPSKNVADVAKSRGIDVLNEFFDQKIALEIINKHKHADVILSANVMCHIPYIHSIFKGIKTLLKEDGIFVFEDPYLGDIIEKSSFDQIYDEHVFLFSEHSIDNVANMNGLELIDINPQITHGGSMRYTISHKGKRKKSIRVIDLINKEKSRGLDSHIAFEKFAEDVDVINKNLIKLLTDLKSENKKVVAYGATSKSTTVTNFFNITPDLVECIYDTTPIKHYKFSPGKHIPIRPYEEFHDSNPDYVLLFAWNHSVEIMKKEKDFMGNERKWITYFPVVEVI